MSTSSGPILAPAIETPSRVALRLRMAEHSGSASSAIDLLDEVTPHPDVDPWDHWSVDGGS